MLTAVRNNVKQNNEHKLKSMYLIVHHSWLIAEIKVKFGSEYMSLH